MILWFLRTDTSKNIVFECSSFEGRVLFETLRVSHDRHTSLLRCICNTPQATQALCLDGRIRRFLGEGGDYLTMAIHCTSQQRISVLSTRHRHCQRERSHDAHSELRGMDDILSHWPLISIYLRPSRGFHIGTW